MGRRSRIGVIICLTTCLFVGFQNCGPAPISPDQVSSSCSNGATDFPNCINTTAPVCQNGANNPPTCDSFSSCDSTPHEGSETRERFLTSLVDFGQSCSSETQTRDCINGVFTSWSGSYQFETCEIAANSDSDSDGVLNVEDNCPSDPNVDQADLDFDSIGDECDFDFEQKRALISTVL